MNHLLMFFYLATFVLGISSLLLLFLTYLHNGMKLFLYTFILSILISYWTITRIIQHYIEVSILSNLYNLFLPQYGLMFMIFFVITISLFLWNAVYIYFFSFFSHFLLEIPFNRIHRRVFGIISALILLSIPVPFFISQSIQKIFYLLSEISYYFVNPISFIIFIYFYLLIIFHYKKIRNLQFKKMAVFTRVFLSIFIPLIALEYLFPFRMPQMIFIRGIAMTMFYLCWNIFCIITIFNYYSKISFAPHSLIIVESFIEEYGISKREKDIISLLLDQKTYEQIAEKLFISIKTVETHISHIYQKTAAKNRIELD